MQPVAGTMAMNPRTVLLSPRRRRPRKVSPPSRGTAKGREIADRSQRVWTRPARTKARMRKSAQASGDRVVFPVNGSA